jgi:Holliday junction resolvase-like predicted endonuclease
MTNFSHGRAAEAAAVEYLKKRKFEIMVQNWRTRYCEIDVVAKKRKTIYFVEVKYRQSGQQGSGLGYITPAKLKQMELAARFWTAENGWTGDYRLAGLEVSGAGYQITNFLAEL